MVVGRWSALQQVHGTGNQLRIGALNTSAGVLARPRQTYRFGTDEVVSELSFNREQRKLQADGVCEATVLRKL